MRFYGDHSDMQKDPFQALHEEWIDARRKTADLRRQLDFFYLTQEEKAAIADLEKLSTHLDEIAEGYANQGIALFEQQGDGSEAGSACMSTANQYEKFAHDCRHSIDLMARLCRRLQEQDENQK